MTKVEPVDYAAVIADLRHQRALLDKAIAAIEALNGIARSTATLSNQAGDVPSKAPHGGCFVGMSLLTAAKTYLQSRGEPQRTTHILAALQRGGVALTGKSPINSLGAVLNKDLKIGGQLVKERRGVWSLSSLQSLGNVNPGHLNGKSAGIRVPVSSATSNPPRASMTDG